MSTQKICVYTKHFVQTILTEFERAYEAHKNAHQSDRGTEKQEGETQATCRQRKHTVKETDRHRNIQREKGNQCV